MEACVGANHPSRKLMAFGHGAIDACALLDDFRDAKAKAAAAGLWGAILGARRSALAFVDKCNDAPDQVVAFEQWHMTLIGHLDGLQAGMTRTHGA